MKNKKPILLFSALLALPLLASCGGDSYATTTHIHCFNFGGGIGSVWLKEAAARFETKVKDKSYHQGKTGVKITWESSFNSNTKTMKNSQTNIFFDERFSDITELAQEGLLLNLDSLVKDESRAGGSLESKIFDQAKAGLQLNGSYYGLPHYEYYNGFSYNSSLFAAKNAYFTSVKDEKRKVTTKFGDEYFVIDQNDPKDVGPDGVAGTSDDGLPRTIQQLFALCDYLKNQGNVSPFVISGQHHEYSDDIICGIWTNLAGVEKMKNYFNCSGEIDVVKRDESGNIVFEENDIFTGAGIKKPQTEKVTLTEQNGYLGNDMVEKYYAIAAAQLMFGDATHDTYYNKDSSISTKSHYDAQRSFILTKDDGTSYSQGSAYDTAAMLVDGSYWFNESGEMGPADDYELLAPGKKFSELGVRWMPLPTYYADSDIPDGNVEKAPCLVDGGHSYGMINGNISNDEGLKQACLDFMSFLYSEDELKNFTITTGMPRMISYSLSDSEKASAGKFYENLFSVRKDDGSNVVGLSSTSNNFAKFKNLIKISLGANCLRGSENQNVNTMLNGGKNTTDIFNSYSNNVKNKWPANF